MMAHLAITTEEGLAMELQLGAQPVFIGRAEGNTVRPTDRRCSRRHVVFRRTQDGGFEVEDAGSTYGILLNGRTVSRERLAHRDVVTVGSLQIQFFVDDPLPTSTDEPTDAIPLTRIETAERQELRAQLDALIQEGALLRQTIGRLQDSLSRAEAERDAAREQVEQLALRLQEQGQQVVQLREQVERLGTQLRNARSAAISGGDSTRTPPRHGEPARPAERQALRLAELEEREAQLTQRIQELKKENERLMELNQKHEKREAELTQAVKPALLRVAQLQQELERVRLQLAQAQAELAERRRQGG
ncbi:MAG: FHA domain-containing protein [Myxococcales bacterium]|nr:FHA domain-containing protein [Myxococcota bacterium]MDW8283952.1 FHA domain-containing protein [Myxococcales bacterium]